MAYTYDDFVNAANTAGMMDQFDDDDMKLAQSHPEYGLSMLSLKRDYGNAQTDEQRLLINEAANQLRGSYAPQQRNAAVGGVYNNGSMRDFTYNAREDPVYQDYRKQYLREGDRATANALGQASAASAGRPSSYAVTAATQAGDYYATQLTDKIPDLYNQAWTREQAIRDQERQQMADSYTNLTSQILSAGYQPTEEEMLAAGMTPELVEQLLNAWLVSNPEQAYQQGRISLEDYMRLTGKSVGGGGGGRRRADDEEEKDVGTSIIGNYINNARPSNLFRRGTGAASNANKNGIFN